MAQVSDSIAATVTIKGGPAIRELNALSGKAKETGRAFGTLAKDTSAAGVKIGDASVRGAKGVDAMGRRTSSASRSIGELRAGVGKFQSTIGIWGTVGAAVGTVTAGLYSAIGAQSALTTATKSSQTTFKDASAEVERFAEGAQSIGFSKRAALEAATGFGTLFRGLQFGTKASADFSISLTKLSADLASKVGGSAEEAADALRAMFRGEFDPIEKYGVKVGEAAVATRALQLGLASTKGELSEQDKTLARLTLAYSQTIDAQGDFTRRQADLANQQRIVAATSENVKSSLGAAVTPGYTDVLKGVAAGFRFLDSAAGHSGKTFGEMARDVPLLSGVLGAIGKNVKDSANNFASSEDALKTFSQELAVGREGSDAYRAAVSYLKSANAEAEASANKLGDAIGTVTQKQAQARAETQATIGAIQAQTNAQRNAADASIRVADARNSLADAERSVSDLRRKGKVDADAVADAEQRVADAAQSSRDARQRQADAERRLGDLRAHGKVDAEEVADAERSIADASRGVAAARRSVAEAEAEVARLRAGPTGDEAGDAARNVTRAQLDLERAQQGLLQAQQELNDSRGSETLGASLSLREAELALAEATDNLADAQQAQLDLQNRGKEGSAALTDATLALEDARQQERDAVLRQTEAEANLRTARAGDPEFERKIADAAREVDAARRGVESAVRAENKASTDLRLARAGDPDFERNLARAEDEVKRATENVTRAEQDRTVAKWEAALAQAEFNAKVSEGTGPADRLREAADRLGISYNRLHGEALGAASGVNALNGALGISASIGATGAIGAAGGGLSRAAGLSTSTPSTSTVARPSSAFPTSTTVVVELDGRVLARSVTDHQNATTLRGGG